MEALEKLLEDLNRAVETEDAAVNVASLVASVEAIGSGDLDELDLDTCTALLLAPGQTASGLPGDSIKRSSSSLMQFLTASLRMKDRDIVRAKVHAVKFLAVYVKKQIKYVMIYAEKLAIDLIQLFKMEDSSEVKAALLLPVKNILRPRIYSVEAIDAVAKLDDADDEVDDYDDCVPFDLDTFPLQSIYQVLVEEVRLNKKLTKGVHREALATLGILVAVYPAAAFTVSVIDIILSLCDEALKNAFNSRGKDPDFPAIAGAFSCLDKCLYHFEARYVNSTELWKYLLQAAQSSAQEDTSRFSAAGKAIKLIRNHAQLFVNVIGMNAQTSYGVVAAAHKSGKVALYKHSEGALQAVLAAAASYLVQNMHTGSNAVKKTCDMVNKLLEAHLKVLQDPGTLRSNSDDTVVALQGLNALSLAVSPAPLGQYAFQLNYCCADVIRTVVEIGDHYNRYQRSSKGDSAESDEANGEGTAGNNQSAFLVYCKSLFFCVVVSYLFNATVHCLSGTGQGGKLVVLENTASDQRLVQFLEELGVEVIVGYTKMYSKQQRFTRTAMVKLFIMHTLLGNRSDLTRKKHIADLYVTLTSLLDLAFLRTLARKESTDHIAADHARLSSYSVFSVEEDRLVFVYSSLWHALLKPTDKTLRLFCLDMLGLSFLDVVKQRLVQWLFSKCMSTIKSLQLTYSKAEEALQDVNNVGCLPDNIVDQDLFLNLVTFFEILVTLLDKQDTYNYADFVFVNVMEMSQKLPLLSGFYRMLSCLLIHLEDLLACGIHANNEQASVVSCMSQISIFVMKLQENLVASPNDYNNELLQSIVKVILSLPIECLSIDCMYITLHISLSSNIHLNKCIAMLNKHFTFDPKKFLNGTATSLLPLLSKYIVPISMENLSVNERHEYVSIGRKKLKTHLHSSNIVNSLQKQQVTTEQILLFLGKLGHHNQAMLQSPSEVIQDSLMWSAETKLSLQLSVSNQQGKLEIFIDKLLPTITEICRVKIDMTQTPNVNLIKALSSAAEALYNVVIFMIASSASLGVNYSDFYKRILPVVLQLASQSRINAFVVLFESLLDQLVSYFTSPHHRNSKNEEYGRVLLETLLENIVATNDNNMKELCGTTFTKYLQCCIHSHIRNRTEGSVNMKVIDTALEELCFLLSHPLESKQRAGLLLLSNVYKLIRSELVIVKRFSMFILYLLIKLLDVKDLSEENEKSITTLVLKFEEMVVYYGVKYRQEAELHIYEEYRKFPRSLHEITNWLWQHIVQCPANKIFRRAVMRTFISLVTILDADWSSNVVARNAATYVANWTDMLNKFSGCTRAVIAYVNEHVNHRMGSNMVLLLFVAALDVYNWLVSMQIIQVSELFDSVSNSNGEYSCRIFSHIKSVLDSYISSTVTSNSDWRQEDAWIRSVVFLTTIISKSPSGRTLTELQAFGIPITSLFRNLVHFSLNYSTSLYPNTGDIYNTVFTFMKAALEIAPASLCDEISGILVGAVDAQVQHFQQIQSDDENSYSLVKRTQLLLKLALALRPGVVATSVIHSEVLNVIFHLCRVSADEMKLIKKSDTTAELLSLLFAGDLPFYSSGLSLSQETLVFSDSAAAKNPSLLSVIAHPKYGSKLYQQYSRLIIDAVVTAPSSSPVSLYHSDNLLHILSSSQHEPSRILLEDILSYISDQIACNPELVNYVVYTMVPLLESRVNLTTLSSSAILQLATILAQVTAITSRLCECRALRTYMLHELMLTFDNPKDVTKVVQCLSWLPLLLPGCTTSSSRSLSLVDMQGEAAELARVQEGLENLVSTRFPLDSSQLPVSSSQGKEFLVILEAYLQAFQACGSVIMLPPLYPALREGKQHIYYQSFIKVISSVPKSLPSLPPTDTMEHSGSEHLYTEVKHICNFCLEVIYNVYQDVPIKRILLEFLLLPTLLSLSSKNMVVLFSLGYHRGLQIRMSSVSSDHSIIKVLHDIIAGDIFPANMSDETLLSHVYMVTVAYKMLSLLYDHCYVGDVKLTLTAAFVHGDMSNTVNIKGSELTSAVLKVAHKFVRTQMSSIPNYYAYSIVSELKETLFELYAAAFSCLVTIVCKTQSEEKFYDNFIFSQKPSEDIYDHILHYPPLDVENDASLFSTFTRKFDDARLSNNIYSQSDWAMRNREVNAVVTVQRLCTQAKKRLGKGGYASQYLQSCMLSSSQAVQSVAAPLQTSSIKPPSMTRVEGDYTLSQYDYTNMLGNGGGSSATDYRIAFPNSAAVVAGWDDQQVVLEMNHFNSIHIMGTLVRAIQRMYVLFKEKWIANTATLPNWLKECYELVLSSKHKKAKMFILRLFINQPVATIIKPWLHLMLPGVLENIYSIYCHNKKGYHYLLRDVMFTFWDTWADVTIPVASLKHAGMILNFLLTHLDHDDPDVLKENLNSVCSIFPRWLQLYSTSQQKTRIYNIALPYVPLEVDAIIRLLNTAYTMTGGAHGSIYSTGSIAVRYRLAALDVVHCLLDCNYPLLVDYTLVNNVLSNFGNPNTNITTQALLQAILDNLSISRKELVQSSCQVIGQILDLLNAHSMQAKQVLLYSQLGEFENKVVDIIDGKDKAKRGKETVVYCYKCILANYSGFLKREMICRPLLWFNSFTFQGRYSYLEMLLRHNSIFVKSGTDCSHVMILELVRSFIKPMLVDRNVTAIGRGAGMVKIPLLQVYALILLTKHIQHICNTSEGRQDPETKQHNETVLQEVLISIIGKDETVAVRYCINANNHVSVRYAAYNLLISIFIYREKLLAGSSSKDVLQSIVQLLLNGLNDPDGDIYSKTDVAGQLPKDSNILDSISNDSIQKYISPAYWSKRSPRKQIKQLIYEFFQGYYLINCVNIGQGLHGYIILLCKELFDIKSVNNWLAYAPSLLLSVILQHPKNLEVLFNISLLDNVTPTYQPLSTRSSRLTSSAGFSSSTPLFALERTSQSIQMLALQSPSIAKKFAGCLSQGLQTSIFGTSYTGEDRNMKYVKGTQQISWTQNSTSFDKSTLNYSYHKFAEPTGTTKLVSGAASSSVAPLSSFPFQTTVGGGGISQPGTFSMGPPTSLPRYMTTQRLPVRFSAHSMQQAQSSIINKMIYRRTMTAEEAQNKHMSDVYNVDLHAEYRVGEAPDIAISAANLIKPLQTLCLYNPAASSQLLCLLLVSQYRSVDLVKEGIELIDCLCDILKQCQSCSPTCILIPTILQVFIELSSCQPEFVKVLHAKLPDATVCQIALSCGCFHIGIRYLEAKLNIIKNSTFAAGKALSAVSQDTAKSTGHSAKRRKGASSSAGIGNRSDTIDELFAQIETSTGDPAAAKNTVVTFDDVDSSSIFIQLMHLYDRLSEENIVNTLAEAVFLNDRSSDEAAAQMKEAIDYEARGEFTSAVEVYNSLLRGIGSNSGSQLTGPCKKRNFAASQLDASSLGQGQVLGLLVGRSLECYHKLASWESLYSCTAYLFEGSGVVDRMDLDGESAQRVLSDFVLNQSLADEDRAAHLRRTAASYYLRSFIHLSFPLLEKPLAMQSRAFLATQLIALKSNHSASLSSLDLAASHILLEDYYQASLAMKDAVSTFLNKFTMLHAVAYKGKAGLLLSLQRMNELRDFIFYNTQQAYIASKISAMQGLANSTGQQKKIALNNLEDDIIKAWTLSEPNIFDPLHHWSDVIWTRSLMLQKLADSNSNQDAQLSAKGAEHISGMFLRSAVAAVAQGKLTAVKPLLETANAVRKVSGRRAGLTIEEVQVVTFYNRASILEQVEFNKVEELLTKTKKMLDMKDDSLRKAQAENLVAFKNSKLGLEDAIVQRIYGDLLVLAKDMSARYPNARSPETSVGALDKYTRSVMLIEETATIEDMQREAIIVSLREKSYTCLARHSLQMLAKYKANELDGAAGKDLVSVTARCQQVLFDRAGVFAASNVAPEMLAHIVIESMIKGLSLQSSFCMERVLVLFNLITEHTQHVSGQVTFGRSRSGYLEQLLQIPAWCYLRFSAQLMGSLDLSCGDVVYPIVLHIAKTYPHALHYSFRITCEVNSSISLNKAKYSQLHSLLANKSIDDFVEALLACSHPELRFSDAVKSIDSLLAKNTNTNLTSAVKQQVLNLLDEVYTFCLSQSWPRIGHKIGKYNRHFAKALLPKVNSIVGSKRESIFNKDVLGKLKELRDATQNSMKHTSGRVSVAEFSEWLGDFDSTTLHILIPEQYTIVHATPREPEVINTIAGELLVMESIRKPKRLSLVSNTGVGYRFLVKGGEDLRNDERIEQLFGLMNQIVRKHERYSVEQDIVFNQALDFSQPVPRYLLPEPATRPTLQADTGVKALEALRARTYGVVPMSTKVGILEWVPNTISLRAILAEEMVKDDYIQKTQRQAIEEKDGHLELSLFALSSAELRTNWLKGNGTTDYHQMYRNAPLASAAAVYDAITSILPTYYLQRRLLSMSRNAETYYTLLHEFLASLSVNNIFGYILGIGDRHLENLLLDSSTGSIVNIDFGICFGMGASVLPVPELIPMRLTRQLTDIAQPLQGLEVIRQHMQRVLGCLRKEKSLLQNALEIYINDPLMDWMRGAAEALDREALLDQREQLLGGSFESSGTLPPNNKEMSESVLWEPVRRVGGALRKLSGEDPLALLQEDLSNNVMVTRMKSYDGLCRILGDVRRLLGAEAGGTNAGRTGKMKAAVELTVEEQVDALMAMATDPNVLVRQWVGLQAWL